MELTINPVNADQYVALPDPWAQLAKRGFHEDLLARARGFMLAAERLGFHEIASESLALLGHGFEEPFSAEPFLPTENDPDRAFKRNHLTALSALSEEFGDRVSSVVWETFAFLGTRPDPMKEATILSVKQYLTIPWWFADTVLHAAGKVYGLKLHIDSRIFAGTGMVLEHNCDCSHSARAPQRDGQVSCLIAPHKFKEATAALMSHLLSESLLIGALKMPFDMGLSPEAAEAMSLA